MTSTPERITDTQDISVPTVNISRRRLLRWLVSLAGGIVVEEYLGTPINAMPPSPDGELQIPAKATPTVLDHSPPRPFRRRMFAPDFPEGINEEEYVPMTWEERLMAEYGITEIITRDGFRYTFTEPITVKNNPNFSERAFIVSLIAYNNQIPRQIMLSLAYCEGWDYMSGEHMAQWRKDGSVVVSPDGSVGMMQVRPDVHCTAAEAKQIREDMVANIKFGAKVLLKGGRGESDNIESWRLPIRHYNSGGYPWYEETVLRYAYHPPPNPLTGQPAW